VYLSRDTTPGAGQWEIERWHTADGGATFDPPTSITKYSVLNNVRPVVPWGPPGEVSVLWMSGNYAAWYTGYRTQLRELTTGLAPTTARISPSATGINLGATVQIGGRVVQGDHGEPVPGATIELLGHVAGRPDQVLRTARADVNGLVNFSVKPSSTMRFTVRTLATSTWGAAKSPSVVVSVAQPSAVRISASSTTIRRGQSVLVGMRAADASTGALLPHMTIELWQSAAGGSWQRVGRYITDAVGLVRVTRWPTVSVTYQARLLASSEHQAAASPKLAVHVT
ncbi:MAG TPA: hypothetical protein VE441_01495, partial [Mycobacterium sp.]|nr:hypothetical protein [Mycobacterium sp.]